MEVTRSLLRIFKSCDTYRSFLTTKSFSPFFFPFRPVLSLSLPLMNFYFFWFILLRCDCIIYILIPCVHSVPIYYLEYFCWYFKTFSARSWINYWQISLYTFSLHMFVLMAMERFLQNQLRYWIVCYHITPKLTNSDPYVTLTTLMPGC